MYEGTGSALKSSFVVHPGADPSDIRLDYRGAANVFLEASDTLRVTTPAGSWGVALGRARRAVPSQPRRPGEAGDQPPGGGSQVGAPAAAAHDHRRRRHLYPLWQFDRGGLVSGLAEILALFPEAAVDGWTLAAWLRTPDPDLDEPPLAVLNRGEVERVRAVARRAARALAA